MTEIKDINSMTRDELVEALTAVNRQLKQEPSDPGISIRNKASEVFGSASRPALVIYVDSKDQEELVDLIDNWHSNKNSMNLLRLTNRKQVLEAALYKTFLNNVNRQLNKKTQ